ncbi:MAG: helix-turn-helix domain-containing protein [Cognatishimia activa]
MTQPFDIDRLCVISADLDALACGIVAITERGETPELQSIRQLAFQVQDKADALTEAHAQIDQGLPPEAAPRAIRQEGQTSMPRIKEVREKAGVSRKELAKRLGCDVSKISRLENGKRKTKTETLKQIAIALNCHPTDFYRAA